MGIEYTPQIKGENFEEDLAQLQETEERCKIALKQAMDDGTSSESVIEQLQSMYLQAKRAREEFEANL